MRNGSPGRKPRLELVAPEPARVLYERAQEPSEDSPILYCERSYVVDGLQSDEELASHLLAELAEIREGWRERDSSQFVQLASFDHEFESEPRFPPLATLSWKDWQGRTELWVRGVRRSAAPPLDPELGTEELGTEELEPELLEDHRPSADSLLRPDSTPPGDSTLPPDSLLQQDSLLPPELDSSAAERRDSDTVAAADEAPLSETAPRQPEREPERDDVQASSSSVPAAQPRKGDSGTSWQSPARSGAFPIPVAEEPAPPPPSSQRVPAGEELIGLSFERMNELSYLPDLATGAEFLVNTLEEFLPCSGIALHLLDAERREFVLFRALGPRAPECVGNRQSATDSLLGASVQLGRAVRIEGIARKRLWAALGLDVAYGMCAPLQQGTRVLGAVELGRTRGEGEFSDGQLKALQFICEQFAEFAAEHPFVPQR